LTKASYEPVKVTLTSDQGRVFSKEHLDKIRDDCGLMEIYKSVDKDAAGERADVLVLLGEAGNMTKAQDAIQEVIKKEGAVESVELTDTACKELMASKGAKIQELQSKYSTYIQVIRKLSQAKIFGSAEGVESTKKAIVAFAKKADSMSSKTLTLEPDQIGRVIGSKGATLNHIRKECSVQINIDNTNPIVEIRGDAKAIELAVKMINDVLEPKEQPTGDAAEKPAAAAAAEPAKAAAKPKAKAKAKEFKSGGEQDFPSLGGNTEPKKTKPAAKAWGKNAEAEAVEEKKTPEQAYPTLAAKPKAKAAAAPVAVVEEEEEDGGDCDDPFAMMGGMGAEVFCQVTMMEEKDMADMPDADADPAGVASEAAAGGEAAEEEEEDAGDCDDPFAMMGGMGAEVFCQVTMMEEKSMEDMPAAGVIEAAADEN